MTLCRTLILCLALPLAHASAADRPVQVLWDGAADSERAKASNTASATLRLNAKAGGATLPSVFLHPRPQGRARLEYPAKQVSVPKGRRAFLLAAPGIADGVKWDDEKARPDGVRFYVNVNGKDVLAAEVAASVFVPLAAPVALAQELAVTLATDAGPKGNTSYDWALFGLPTIVALDASPIPAGEAVAGASGVLVVQGKAGARAKVEGLTRDGKPVPGATASVTLPAGASYTFVSFDFGSSAACEQWRWRGEGVAAAWGGSWQPEIRIEHAGPAQAATFQGERLRVRFALRNAGKGTLLPRPDYTIECNGQRKPVGRIAPGEVGELEFDLGVQPGPRGRVQATATLGQSTRTHSVSYELWPTLPALPPDRPAGVRAARLTPDYVLMENRSTRWVFCERVRGLGALVYVWADGQWEPAGTVSPWAQYSIRGAGVIPVRFKELSAKPVDGGVQVAVSGQVRDLATCLLTATLDARQPVLRVSLIATALKDGPMPRLAGPAVLAGDRGTGAGKGIAIFPGLEYLNGDEASSSTRDLAPPLHKRWQPHKFKVTLPMMMVETRPAGPVLGVVWDPRQKWDGRQIAPTACFASPNFLTRQDNHLMQLALPSTPDALPENEYAAAPGESSTLKAGQTWRLEQHIVACQPKPDATAALLWFDKLVGFPEAEAWPRSFEEEMRLSRHGFMVSVWDEEAKGSKHCVGDRWKPTNSPGYATLLLMDGRAVAKGEEKRRVLERVKLMADKTLAAGGPAGLMSRAGCHIMGGEFPYHWGSLPRAIDGLRAEAYRAAASQEADGGWGYYPGKKQKELGPRGARVVGIAARNAYTLAKWAALSGDPAIEQSLRAALKHMERYVAPRGSQGWECPIFEPDVLAAAYAIRTYVWAYMATGEKRWLGRARYWARTGLPFQYTWDDGQHPGMRYASIPVFGSTYYTHTWIGLPVQWCGLVYAYALVELMRFDSDPVWRKQVEGITSSAMHQQWPWDSGALTGTLPDSYGNWFTKRNPWYINPEDIVVNLLALKGLDPGLRAQRVKLQHGVVHVAAGCDVQAVGETDSLAARLHYLPGEIAYATVAPVSVEEVRVLANGQPCPRKERLAPGETGWAYDPAMRALAVGVKCDDNGDATFSLTRVRFAKPKAAGVRRSSWEFETSAEGWLAAHSCTVSQAAGALVVRVTGRDPYALSGPAGIDAGKHKRLRVRAKMSAGEGLGLFWRTNVSRGWSPKKQMTVALKGDGAWREVVFDLSQHALWTGKVIQIRLDPEPADLPEGATLEVDWVRAE